MGIDLLQITVTGVRLIVPAIVKPLTAGIRETCARCDCERSSDNSSQRNADDSFHCPLPKK
jgi:hypothetical protein